MKFAQDTETTELLIQRFADLQPEGTILLTRFWEPNGSQRQWSEEWVVSQVDDLDNEEPVLIGPDWVSPYWESGELSDDPVYLRIKLFREVGKVHYHQEWRPVPYSEAAELLISEFVGDEYLKYQDIDQFAKWLEVVHRGIDSDSEGFQRIMVIALRNVADQIESKI